MRLRVPADAIHAVGAAEELNLRTVPIRGR